MSGIGEVTLSGTHKGEYCGIPASGRTVTIELAAFFEFGDGEQAGKIVCERIYWDNETVLAQIRGDADAPTGVGLAGPVAPHDESRRPRRLSPLSDRWRWAPERAGEILPERFPDDV